MGLFNGTAVEEGGGFSMINTYDYSSAEGRTNMYELPVMWDLSEYDGFVVDVAAKDDMTMKLLLNDQTWRWPGWLVWEALFEVKGGFQQ